MYRDIRNCYVRQFSPYDKIHKEKKINVLYFPSVSDYRKVHASWAE